MDIVDVNIVDIIDVSCRLNVGRHSLLARPVLTFNCPSSLVAISEVLFS